MANNQLSEVLQHLRQAWLLRDGAGLTDGQLLEDYLHGRGEVALAALVRRHSPMVWGVCRRVLRNYHDAEDAFQATFLVLVRKAASVVPREMVANWLYGVAHQTALKARATSSKRGTRERQVTQMPEPPATDPELWDDLRPLLDQELSRLPDIYRVAIVLCELEGRTRKEAARQLGVPEGTLAARLARGRVMLAKRLALHGLAVSGGMLAVVLAQNAGSASAPTSVVVSTIKAAGLFAAGQAATSGLISANVAALTEGVLKLMLLTKLKIATAVLLVVGLLGMGVGWLTHQALADEPTDKAVKNAGQKDRTEVRGLVKAVDASQNTIVVHQSKEFAREKTFALAGDAKVLLDDGTGDRLGFQEGKLAGLAEGISVTLRLSADQKVTRLLAEGPIIQGTLKSVDAAARRITATLALTKGEPATDMTFDVAKNAKLFIDEGPATDKSKPAKQPGLADLPANAVVFLKLAANRTVVGSIRAEGHSVTGLVKAVDGAKNTITVTIATKGEPDVDRTFQVPKTAQVFIDDGKPKDKSKPAEAQKIADLPIGAQATVRLSLDGQSVVAIRADGGQVHGTVKAVDAAKNTLTVHDKLLGEKTYGVMKDAGVILDGKGEVKKLADVPVEAVVDLNLLADQKTVREIRAYGPTLTGTVTGNASNDTVSVHNKEWDKTFTVAKDARILIDAKKEGTLTDLIDGTEVRVRLSVDQTLALELHAEGPSFQGLVKSFDPANQVLTLTIGAKNGMGGEDKEFKVTKETVVLNGIGGAQLKPTDLRPDKEVVLRLSIDQKAAASISVLGE